MEIITTFKGGLDDLDQYQSIVIAPDQFAIANDHTFSNKQIEGLRRLCKNKNINMYVLVNKMMFDEDLEALQQHLQWLKTLEVSGIYFADLAVYMIAESLDMKDLLIYAPGMTVVNSEDVKEYVDLGIAGLELANELTLQEKLEIAHNNPHKVGVVIGGYLLMSYSKRKVLSNYFREIKKDVILEDNYDLRLKERTRDGHMPIYEDNNGSYIYSEYVFHSFKVMKQLLEAPFKYFRIDGIFLDKQLIEDLLDAYEAQVVGRQDDFLEFIQGKYPEYYFDDIFYDTKTSEVK